MRNTTLMLMIASALSLSACKKEANDTAAETNANAPAPTGMLGAAADQAKAKAAEAAIPQPDANKPLASYAEVESGLQIMFLYVAASRLPPDVEKLASSFSQEYRETSDSFRKNDLLAAIKPQLLEKIAQAKAEPYGWMDLDDYDGLDAYDFERKGFPVAEFAGTRNRYYGDAYEYKITWINSDQFALAPVPDETVARQLEAMRTNYANKPRLKIYFFAQSADLNDQRVNAVVTRVQITDKSGRVLAEYGPDRNAQIKTKSEAEEPCLDAVACAAQAAW